MQKKCALIIAIILFSVMLGLQSCFAVDIPVLTVSLDKSTYTPGEIVHINGTLIWEPHQVPVPDGLVGVEVRDPLGLPVIFRTRPSGSLIPQNSIINFTQFYPCDSNGVPKYSFKRGQTIWIYAEVKNYDQMLPHAAVVCIVLYDANSVPMGVWHPSSGTIQPNAVSAVFFQALTLSTAATLGTATMYGSVFSDFPKNGGYPYCPEKATTLTITTSTTLQSAIEQSGLLLLDNGTYDLSFKFPSSGARAGNYTVYASTYYYELLLTASARFVFSLIGDINGDGAVDIYDAILLSSAYNTIPGSPRWDARADLNHDNVVDIFDAILLASNFGEGAF